MLAVKEARELIENANFDWLSAVYAYNVPKEELDSTDKTIVLVRDVNTRTDLEGNDFFFGTIREVEVQIFYQLSLDDPEINDLALMKLFKKNYLDIKEIIEHTIDPDTSQLTGTFYFTQTKGSILNG